jgi:PPOX class probable F420-dependent enzyme
VGQADPLSAGAPGWALDFLRAGRVGRLATADAAGRPLVVPICYVFDGRACYSAIDAKPKRAGDRPLGRLRNIAENPQVALVVDHYDEAWERLQYVIVHGLATTLAGGPEFTAAIDLLVDKYPQYRTLALDRDRGTVIRIAPERLTCWRYIERSSRSHPGPIRNAR